MRRGAKWAIGLLGGLGALAGGLHHWPVASVRAGADIDQAIAPSVGLRARPPAGAALTLLPWPTLRVSRLELVGDDGVSALSAPAARFPLSLPQLFRGRFVPVGATLLSPTASVDLDAAPTATAEARARSGAASAQPPALWSHARIVGGVLRVVSASRGLDALIENLGGSFDWPAAGGPLRFSLAGAWRDERATIEGKIDDPRAFAEKRSTGVTLSVASRPLVVVFDGEWGGDATSGFAGRFSARTPSLNALERLFRASPAPSIAGGAASLEGEAQINDASLALSEARLALAGQNFEGALAFSQENGRTAISGTLAADSLQVEPLIGAPPAWLNAQGAWSAEPFAFAPPRGLDLDLRISAARAYWRGHEFDDAAGSLLCKDGTLTATLLQSAAYQGALKGQLTLTRRPEGLETQATASLVDADIGAALADFGWSGYHGRGGLELSLRAIGGALADAVASLSGTASLDLQAGVVDGVSIEEAMRRSLRRPIDVARDLAAGKTTFTRARARFAVANGVAAIGEAKVEGPGAALAIDGAFDVASRTLHVRMAATQTDAQGAPSANAARLTIALDGPWSAPTIAAAPGGG